MEVTVLPPETAGGFRITLKAFDRVCGQAPFIVYKKFT